MSTDQPDRPSRLENLDTHPGALRASDSDRDQVAEVLGAAFAEGRLTREEHDERLDQLMQAKTFDDLIPLTRDLVYAGPAPTTTPRPDSRIDTNNASSAPDRIVGILGGTTRKGKWRVRSKIQSYALMGGAELDMTEAVFESPVVEISGFWCMGGLEITVPEGVEVRDQVMGILGGSDVKVGEPDPNAPVLVIKGVAMLGGVEVKNRRQGKRKRKHHAH